MASTYSIRAEAITNLQQLTPALSSKPHTNCDVRIEATVRAASRSEVGVLIVHYDTDVELLEVENFGREIRRGEHLGIQVWQALLRLENDGTVLAVESGHSHFVSKLTL